MSAPTPTSNSPAWVLAMTSQQRQAVWDDPFGADMASYEWEEIFPDHCFICHINGDEPCCGKHCPP